ncbi:flavonoid 3',5'-hydroxylase [Ranunculus cassubicifolius]
MWGVKELIYAVIIFLVIRFCISLFLTKESGKLPPGPKGWPVLGALPLLGSNPHVSLAEMSKKYGPIVYLKLGSRGMVVASTPDSAREFLKTHDLNFANRPTDADAIHMAYNSQDMVHAEYGPRWKLLRAMSNLHMLGSKAIEGWSNVRRVEIGIMLEVMYQSSCRREPVEVAEMTAFAIANMIGQVILSRRVFATKGTESTEFKDMVVELLTSAGLFNIGDYIPSIAWMDLQGIVKGMKCLHTKFDLVLDKMFREHIATRNDRKEKPDLLDTLFDDRENNTGGDKLSDTNIKGLLMNLFVAGTDTSTSTVEWALTEMMVKPSIFSHAQAEMDKVIGRNRRLEESDIPNLPYLQAICKETLRKHPPTPLNLPRESIEACQVNGYYIPKGTRLCVNVWAIGRDPNVWDNPLVFDPERFLTGKYAKIEPRGNDFELIPFGAGRRICAGNRMAIALVEYILGSLLHSFEWTLPDGVELNMEEKFGLALQKTLPLSAILTPRLPPSVYAL